MKKNEPRYGLAPTTATTIIGIEFGVGVVGGFVVGSSVRRDYE
jgi:hypothetical protein